MTPPSFERHLLSSRLAYPPSGLFRNPLRGEQIGIRDAVQSKVDSGEYKLEAVPCFCGADRFLVLAEVDRYRLRVQTVLCRRCGLLSTNPRMSQEAYRRFYDQEYRLLYEGSQDDLGQRYKASLDEATKAMAFLRPHLPAAGVAYELGCNMGATLGLLQNAGWRVAGADFGRAHVEAGRRYSGVSALHVGGLECLEELKQPADLFVLQHVLEHFLDLPSYLARIRGLLGQGGLIYVEVPGLYGWIPGNCGGDVLGYLQNAHVYHFSQASLDYVMECAGFERVSGDEYIRSVYRLSERVRLPALVPVNEAERAESFLRRLELKILPRLLLKRACAAIGLLEPA